VTESATAPSAETSILRSARAAWRGDLPARYAEEQRVLFDELVAPALVSGAAVLDVGAGRAPTVPLGVRPGDIHYAGLDLSRAELDAAPAGSYDETVVSDAARRVPELENRFDLALSWQVLEHVKPLDPVIANLRSYLRPGGRLVAQFSGTFSAFGVLNQLLPHRASVWLLHRLNDRPTESVFPAYYHHCWQRAIEKMFVDWTSVRVVPRYLGAGYFRFSRPLLASYVAYEEWAMRGEHPNLASYYLIDAVR